MRFSEKLKEGGIGVKKLLTVLSIVTGIGWAFILIMFINPAVIGFDDGTGFFIELICIILTVITIVSWVVFGIVKKLKNGAAKR